ncbi:MAG: UDP-N-acetylglucosamine 1-carboxyvinyltransferase [Firmicutes bacterium]|nr:UDP-N-acetylglucosamine 1-carboxyvinyltransferase [Bacillota bacterium]
MVLHIKGGKKLRGEIKLTAAKNSILPILAACIMTKHTVVLKNCAPFLDVLSMIEVLKSLGAHVLFIDGDIVVNCERVQPLELDNYLTKSMRSSIFILGPLLSRFKTAVISAPGGCNIGLRPIDLHLKGLNDLGVKIDASNEQETINFDAKDIKGGIVNLSFPSVGATENLMMTGTLLEGSTLINGAAKEPEIVDLANFINSIGGKIFGAGTDSILIEGVKSLSGGEYSPILDRIIAGTYLCATASAGGKIKIDGLNIAHVYSIVEVLKEAGVIFKFKAGKDYLTNSIEMISSKALKGVGDIVTQPYPGFPTDMQSQLVAALCGGKGQSILNERLFENRFRYIGELRKMGANIACIGQSAVVCGVGKLNGARVAAEDLRGGAALIIGGLSAEGTSIIHGLEHIDRGYYKIEDDLIGLGAEIKRVKEINY